MTTCELRVPPVEEMSPEEVQRFLAIKLFEAGRITLGTAAEMAGCAYREFIDVLSAQGIPWMRAEWDETYEREFAELSACPRS